MDHIFKYSVLMATPDASRGERVNVGIAVYLEDRIDVRFAELSKVRALTGSDWTEYANGYGRCLAQYFSTGAEACARIVDVQALDPVIKASDLGWFSAEGVEQYEPRVRELLSAMVFKPKAEAERPKSTRINTEIAKLLKKTEVLATREETIDSHKVVRDYFVEDDLRADFAQQNGVLRVAATLDLRRPHVDIKEATLKAIVLDRARKVYDEGTQRIGVYALCPSDASASDQFKSHLSLLHEYSDQVYNWEVPTERNKFMNYVYSGVASAGALL